jgi:peptidoglycan/xylan/chitin deacetylase (PgdA/CDA1 family)
MKISSISRRAVGAALHWTGLGRAFERATRPTGAIILMYHSVAEDETAGFVEPPNRIAPQIFERQMAFLREQRRVVPLSRLVDDIVAGESPPAGTVCITFDDGYRDNLTVAAPILEKYRLPATLFLATGCAERGEAQWSDTLHWLLRGHPCPAWLHQRLLEASHKVRRRLLDEIWRELAPVGRPPRLMLDWDEARRLVRDYPLFEIAGHTRDHIDLSKHAGEARAQLDACAADLRRELGVEARHFAYPYGRSCAETRRAVIEAGWRCALVADAGRRVEAASDRYAMPRVEAPRSMTQLAFKTSGAYPGALALLGLQ